MQAVFDAPVGAHGAGEQLGVERRRGEIEAAGGCDLAAALDLGLDGGDGGEVREAGLAGEAAAGLQPVGLMGDAMAAQLEAAVIAVGGSCVSKTAAGAVSKKSRTSSASVGQLLRSARR